MGKSKKREIIDRCKCCLEEIGLKNMWKEYYSEGEREIYGEMLTDCFAITWEQPSDIDAEYICDTCIARLRDAFSFKKEILYTEHLILERLKKDAADEHIKEEETDGEIETEYLNIEYLEEDDTEKEKPEIKIEIPPVKQDSEKPWVERKNRKYTKDDFEKCLEAVKSNTLSQSKASLLYNVPRKAIIKAVARHRNEYKSKENENSEDNSKAELSAYIIAVKAELKKHGDNIAAILTNTNATPIHCHNDAGYKCSFCDESFLKPADLKEHTLLTHDDNVKKNYIKGKHIRTYIVKLDITGLKCNICDNLIDTLDECMHHLDDHGVKIHFDINNHIVPFKFEDEELRCTECKIVFYKFRKLLEHTSRHSKNYVCDICGTGYVNRGSFVFHYQNHNKGKFPCDYCSKVFESQTRKKAHEMLVHMRRRDTYKCSVCSERFTTLRKKEKHISSVHGVLIQGVKCQACDKTFSSQKVLRVHVRKDHLQERRYTCDICNVKFFRKVMLKNHMSKHGIKEFQCGVCKKVFGRKWYLRHHMHLHADDVRYKCEYCDASFKQKSSMIGHLKSKHGYE